MYVYEGFSFRKSLKSQITFPLTISSIVPGVPVIIMGCFITIQGNTICLSGRVIVEKGGDDLILLYIILERADYEY